MSRDRRSESLHERSEEERERAREERERRRLAKNETPAAPAPPPLPAPAAPSSSPAGPTNMRAQARVLVPNNRRLHRPHLRAPHLPRRPSRARVGTARAGALLAIVAILAVLGAAAVVLIRRSERKPPPPAPKIVRVLIPEGYTADQIAALAREDGLRGSYMAALGAAVRNGLLRPSAYGAPHGTRSLEGFLFPATYELYAGTRASHLVAEQLTAFRRNFGGGELDRARKLGVTPYELLTVASIVEREAGTAHDRPLVAAVIYNRLKTGMTLGVDATLRYALHDFEHPLTETQLATNSPYNTRLHRGLPPTPISNPGAAAIRAAAYPAHVSYLYYVAGADGCGEQVFSTGYAQFERNAAAYREALRRNGGNVPTCKKK
ncbi:MAG TPA: endolytic transglycosylase MltG [Solirubrobacteraceae bacterium]|nr:endolytic transglycosylase MltG [Solirubrobacteraceae bacterium]